MSRSSFFIEPGTAGFRARMQDGPQNMNDDTIRRLAYGMSCWLKDHEGKKVIISFDARKNSKNFAQVIFNMIKTFTKCEVKISKNFLPTPLLAFATKYFNADMGIMVTASHNYKDDNGLKIYQKNGSQHGKIELLKIAKVAEDMPSNIIESIFDFDFINEEELLHAYAKAIKIEQSTNLLTVAYSPMHGVAGKYFCYLYEKANFGTLITVKEQELPDENFKTASYPNPENETSLKLIKKLMIKQNISFGLLHDPDGDRLKIILKNERNDFYNLSGNELGIIFCYLLIKKANETSQSIVATTLVSTQMIKKMASVHSLTYIESDTGFAQIAEQILLETKKGKKLLFAFEEAIGYLTDDHIIDKDGISSALFLLENAYSYIKNPFGLLDLLDEIYSKYGLFLSLQWSLEKYDLNKIYDFFASNKLKNDPHCPKEASTINKISNTLVILFKDNYRLCIRKSGTENKIKFYLEGVRESFSHKNIGLEKQNMKRILNDMRSYVENLCKQIDNGNNFSA